MNLPETDFPMRANLPANEPKRLEKWLERDLYAQVLEHNRDGEPYVLHDGPPYANGPIHIGHAFNKILKDFVVKSKAQRGYFTPYVPGWDCHGQPIENMVEKTMGPEAFAQASQPEIRQACRDWATRFIDVQREGFKRLGVNADWDHPYLTYVPNYEAGNVEVFKDMYLKGEIYRGRKPIHWCKRCHTALAEAEIEYGDETSPSIFVRFDLTEVPAALAPLGLDRVGVAIWTTTPWTLPANTGVALAPDADYCVVVHDGQALIAARALVEAIAQAAGWDTYEVLQREDGSGDFLVKGSELVGSTYVCPIRRDLVGRFVTGDHVTLDSGTGCVHTAPGHGQEDYLAALEFDLPILMPVDDDGRLTEEAAPFAGLDVDDANPKIIDWLAEQGTLIARQDISHSYPHCWRCHEPVIFRATDQWFVSMDADDLRTRALKAIDSEVRWVPSWANRRIGAMVADRPDWCISRQRSWGVPVPVFTCRECGETVATEATFDAVIDLFYREGADAWFTKEPSEYLPADTACPRCGSHDLAPESDILDVWWESGVSHTSVCRHRSERDGLRFPADLYLEGSDQHRGWFQSSLLTSVGAYGVAPYKSVMHCGFIVDGEGRKMSKSLGNGVDPADVIAQRGADVLRLWVASVDYSQDVSISDEILNRCSDAYRRIRNTFRFMLAALADFDPARDAVSYEGLTELDRLALTRLAKLIDDVEASYDAFKFHAVFRDVYDYVVGDLSSVYLDACKDRLYAEAPDSPARRAAQTAIFEVLEAMVRFLSPILSFTCDEVWECYPPAARDAADRPWSVQLAGWVSAPRALENLSEGERAELLARHDRVLEVREAVTRALEAARADKTVNKSQEARVEIAAPAELLELCRELGEGFFEELLIVSAVDFVEGDELSATISKAEGEKCPRCWNVRELGGDPAHPDVCARCGAVLDRLG